MEVTHAETAADPGVAATMRKLPLGWIAGARSRSRSHIPPDRLIGLPLIRRCRELHPFAARLWQGNVSWRDIEGLARGNVEEAVLGREGDPTADHVTLVSTLAHVTGQPAEQRRGIDRLVDLPELDCDVPGLDPPDLPYILLLEDDVAVASAKRSHLVLLSRDRTFWIGRRTKR